RGRGFGGRGGARGGHASWDAHADVNPEDLPPVERTWTHDGFEEMRRKEEERAVNGRGGRGGFRGGRAGFAGRGRGAFKQVPNVPAAPPNAQVASPAAPRTRAAPKKKAEAPWSQGA